jgi:hypothetical protein
MSLTLNSRFVNSKQAQLDLTLRQRMIDLAPAMVVPSHAGPLGGVYYLEKAAQRPEWHVLAASSLLEKDSL